MKMIVAIVKPAVTESVMDALAEIGISGLTVSEVKGHGRQKGQTEVYRGAEYQVTLVPKVRFEIAVEDSVVDSVVDTIRKTASTGENRRWQSLCDGPRLSPAHSDGRTGLRSDQRLIWRRVSAASAKTRLLRQANCRKSRDCLPVSPVRRTA